MLMFWTVHDKHHFHLSLPFDYGGYADSASYHHFMVHIHLNESTLSRDTSRLQLRHGVQTQKQAATLGDFLVGDVLWQYLKR